MNFAIIAAGDGSRLVHEGVSSPKPLVELDGRPMIRRLTDIFTACGAESIAVIVNESMTDVTRYVARLAGEISVPLRLCVKSTPDSMHSFHEVSSLLPEGKFVLTTVDTIFSAGAMRRLVAAFEADDTADGYMGVTDYIDDEKPLYVGVDATGRIDAYRDEPFAGVRYVSAGVYGLQSPRALEVLRECIAAGKGRMRNYQRALVGAGFDLRAFPMGKVIDVDHASDIAKARQLIREFENHDKKDECN